VCAHTEQKPYPLKTLTQQISLQRQSTMPNWLEILQECSKNIQKNALPLLQKPQNQTTHGKGAGGDITHQIDHIAENTIINTIKQYDIAFILISEEAGIKKIGKNPRYRPTSQHKLQLAKRRRRTQKQQKNHPITNNKPRKLRSWHRLQHLQKIPTHQNRHCPTAKYKTPTASGR